MKNQNWIALLIAILIPSAALLVVRLRPEPQEHPGARPRPEDVEPRRPDGFERVEQNLLRLREPLELTEAQIRSILDVSHASRRELAGIKLELDGLERELDRTLRLPEVPRDMALTLLRRIHELRLRSDTLRLTTPLDIRSVLTPAQREKLQQLPSGDDRPNDGMPPPRDEMRNDDGMPPPRDEMRNDDDMPPPRDEMRNDDDMPPPRDEMRNDDDGPPPHDGMRPPRGAMRPASAEPGL
jgi:Spy/CpxP family protein refolding chaperone